MRAKAVALALVFGASISAQESPGGTQSSQSGWRRVADASAQPEQAQLPGRAPLDEFGQPRGARPQTAMPEGIPEQLTIKAGTYVTVRVDQALSSDHNHPGDAFSATLAKAVVVDGIVVAQRGQTLAGAVVQAQKAGRVQGVSRLGLRLTELTLADGQQVPLQTQLVSRTGRTSVGEDVGVVAGSSATGAAIGAMADWGTGAAIGAGVGAAAGLIGVLLTRGHETLIVPEMVLTFRVEAPATVSTARAPQAFRYVEPEDYAQASLDVRPEPQPAPRRYPYPYPWPYAAPVAYPYWGPGFWGPGVGVYFGPGYYWGGRGYYRAHWH